MNKILTSREAILSAGKSCLAQSGAQALNIRDIAQRCGIAVGSVYNHFSSKEDLIIAVIESIWAEIVHDPKGCSPKAGFVENVRFLFESIEKGTKKYPAFLNVHSTSFANLDKTKGQEVMYRYFAHMKNGLLEALTNDTKVSADVFSEEFTRSAFVSFVFSSVLMLLSREEASCGYFLEIIRRILYK